MTENLNTVVVHVGIRARTWIRLLVRSLQPSSLPIIYIIYIYLYELDLKYDLFIGYSRHLNSRCVYRKSVVGP